MIEEVAMHELDLLENASLDTDSDSDGLADGLDLRGSYNGVPTTTIADGAQRIQYMGVAADSDDTLGVELYSLTETATETFEAGDLIEFSVEMKGSLPGDPYVDILAMDMPNWSEVFLFNWGVEPTGDWNRYYAYGTCPDDVEQLWLAVQVARLHEGDTVDLYVRNAQLRHVSPGEYFDGGSTNASWDGEADASTSTWTDTTETPVEAEYTYNGAGDREKSEVTEGTQLTTTEFDYADDLLRAVSATETGGEGWSLRYLYDEEQKPYAGIYMADGADPVFFAVICDEAGNVVELLDAKGEPFAAYRYDAWGAPLAADGEVDGQIGMESQATVLVNDCAAADIAERQVLRAGSLPTDPESGLAYMQGDYYHAESGMTLAGGAGPYQYQLAAASSTQGASSANSSIDGPMEAWFEFPKGSNNLFKNYDRYSPDEAMWYFDHAVSLVVRCKRSFRARSLDGLFGGEFSTKAGQRTGLGYSSAHSKVGKLIGKSTGRLEVSPKGEWAYTYTTSVLKRDFFDYDSFYHVRFYGRPAADWGESSSFVYRGWQYVVGTCHIDVNELANEPWYKSMWGGLKKLPRGFPVPPDSRFSRKGFCQYSGFSEKVEQNIASRWATFFGIEYSSYDGAWRSQDVDGTQNQWKAWQARPGNHDCYWESRENADQTRVFGKWFRSSGKVTVLTIPEGSTCL